MKEHNERFIRIYEQGKVSKTIILLDRETGVKYLYISNGYNGGLTPLLDADGKPQTEATK